jgi:serine/threonine protein kinase/tetratricopeptide (TPR) repeat protein
MATDDETDDGIGGDEDSMIVGQIMLEIAEAEAQDFEHRRVLTVVRNELLGIGSPLHIHDRYRVIRRLGGGGMGEVYLCEDEQLHRRVAVKFVRGSGNSHDQARLRREAQTLAPLAHPNLVVVFDVGEHDGRTFLAMEYIEGQTLAQWLDDPRPWREVLARFVAAGRGLAAAHRAGTVHRDFKPANVLLGQDGTVKVADFGLALVEGDAHGEDGLSTSSDLLGSRSSVRSAAGTARYMSLEQLEGLGVDARSDQFGFCLALYEGLWGQAPFTDTDRIARREALSRGEPRVPPRSHGLWRVIRRGLAREPDERWPSMDLLLDALERVPRRRRQTARFSATVVLGLGLGLVAMESREDCQGVEQLDVWSDRRSELERQFETLKAGHVVGSSELVLTGLDRWVAAWRIEREGVCRARHARTEDRSALSLRDECLDHQREHVDRLVGTLLEADVEMLAEAVILVDELPRPESCGDGRLEGITVLHARLNFELGRIAELLQDHENAEARYGAAVALARDAKTTALPAYLDALARVVSVSSKDKALELRREAAKFAETRWGRLHPRTAYPMFELGRALVETGNGEQELETAVVIWMDPHTQPHPNLAKAHGLRARAALERHEFDIAEALAWDMVEAQKGLPERHPDRGEPERIFAKVDSVRGDHETALAHARVALEYFELASMDDPGAWDMRELIVDELLALGWLDEAEQQLVRHMLARPSDANTKIIHLQWAELAVCRHLYDDADEHLRALATGGLDLGKKLYVYELLRALVDLRRGGVDSTQLEQLGIALEKVSFTFPQLSEWFDQLEMTPDERTRLDPSK